MISKSPSKIMAGVAKCKRGVRLLGLDQPDECEEGKLKIFVSVALEDAKVAPSYVALVLKNLSSSRTATALKMLVGKEMSVGIEVPVEEGEHFIQVILRAANHMGEFLDDLFEFEPRILRVSAAPQAPGLPRLMQAESVVLCGVDIPEHVEAGDRMRIMVALKRVWHDAPSDFSLIVRNTTPSGEKRATVTHRTLGDDAEAFGLHVPMIEPGVHTISCQVCCHDL